MAIDYFKIVKKGINFSIRPGRWFPFFLADLMFFSILIALFIFNIGIITSLLLDVKNVGILTNLWFIITLFIILIPFGLIKLWLSGAIIYQSYKERDNPWKSFKISYHIFPKMFFVAIFMIILNFALKIFSFIPYGGIITFIMNVIIYLMFFFVYQGIVVDRLGTLDTLRNSYTIFRKRFISLFIAAILFFIISGAILFVFSIPIFGALLGVFVQSMSQISENASSLEFFTIVTNNLINNIHMLSIGGILFLLGSSISQVFFLKAQTEFYLQVKRRLRF